jgi:uncharacterized membrane protein
MANIAITLHLLATIVWVGGMFFAYLAARPALAEAQLEPLLRARLWAGIFRRFFPWVWAAIVALLMTGFYSIFAVFGGFAGAPIFVHSMMGLGILMMLLFGHMYFAPYRRLKRAVAESDAALAGKSLGQIRLVVAINLALGIIVVLVAMTGMFAVFD